MRAWLSTSSLAAHPSQADSAMIHRHEKALPRDSQNPLIKEYTLKNIIGTLKRFKVYSLIKGGFGVSGYNA